MAFLYKDQENHVSNLRNKSRTCSSIGNQKVENQVSKRSVLGVINADNTKISTTRCKKEITKKVSCHVQKIFTFAVYEDAEESSKEIIKKEEKIAEESPSKRFKDDLSAVLDLPSKLISADLQNRQPLQDVLDTSASSEDDNLSGKSYVESPMSIDKTLSPIARPSKLLRKKLFDCDIYSEDILEYLKKIEKLHRPKPNYMRRQPDVSYTMRTILVDWLVDVAQEYKLQPESLFLAVSFIDRFLSVMSVVKSKLQLLGTAAMFVASKYEEIYPPHVSDFVFITDDTYTQKQVLRMEYLILKVLAFDVSGPTVVTFIKHFSVLCDLPEKIVHLATYLSELVLLEGDPYLGFSQSQIAASTILVARYLLDYTDLWPEHYAKVTGYRVLDLASCIEHLNVTHANAKLMSVEAVNNKYSSNKFLNVALVKTKSLDVEEYILHMNELGYLSQRFLDIPFMQFLGMSSMTCIRCVCGTVQTYDFNMKEKKNERVLS